MNTFIIFLLSLIPVFFTWGKLKIGGDIMIPFDTEPLSKYLYQWLTTQNGGYYVQNYFPLYFFYSLAGFLGLSIYQISSLIYFFINFSGGLGVYKLTKLISARDHGLFYRLIPVLFYLFSPALLNGWQYLYFYGVLPWFFYYVLRISQKSEISFVDLLGLQLVIFFGSLDLPNPKYLFYLFILALGMFLASTFLGTFKPQKITHPWWKLLIFVVLNTYLLIPLVYFIFHYQAVDYGVHTRTGYQDAGKMMDAGVSTVSQMFTLRHGANLDEAEREVYLSNGFSVIGGYLFMVVFCLGLFRPRKTIYSGVKLSLSALIIVFLFLATGPNPPFGFLYEFAVTRLSLLAFLRTTAGAVFILSLLYGLYLYIFLLENRKNHLKLAIGVLLTILATGYPIIFGSYYYNPTRTDLTIDPKQKGLIIPEEYLALSDKINSLRLDQKTFVPVTDSSYLHTNWGYFGPPLYYFLYKNYPIFEDKIYSSLENHNVGVVLIDQNIDQKAGIYLKPDYLPVAKAGKLQVLETSRQDFLPHLFLRASTESSDTTLEYKKINSTKYRLVLHKVKGDFSLIFSESFHRDWLLYPGPSRTPKATLLGDKQLEAYKTLEGNETDQASKETVVDFLNKGQLSTLGDFKSLQTKHFIWSAGQKKFSHLENYNIDFISKNYQGSIQNDNLPNGRFFETLFSKPIAGVEHTKVNSYANSWSGNVSELCKENPSCLANSDGSYELEIILEFWPQRLFYLSILISAVGTIYCLTRKK